MESVDGDDETGSYLSDNRSSESTHQDSVLLSPTPALAPSSSLSAAERIRAKAMAKAEAMKKQEAGEAPVAGTPASKALSSQAPAPQKRIRKTHPEIPIHKLGNDGGDKKRIKLPKRNARLTENDLTMLTGAFVGHRVNGHQLAATLGMTYHQKRHRIRELEVAGYLKEDTTFPVKTYGITSAGMMVAGIDCKQMKSPSPSKWAHNNKLASVYINLMRDGNHLTGPNAGESMMSKRFQPGSKLILPERILRQQGGKVDPAVAKQRWLGDCAEILAMEDYPRIDFMKHKFLGMDEDGRNFVKTFWDEFYGGFGSYALVHQNSQFKFSSTYTPDGVILGPHIVQKDGIVTGGSWGIELEENKKTAEEYARILEMYLDHPLLAGAVYWTDKAQVKTLLEQGRQIFINRLKASGQYENPELIGEHILYVNDLSYIAPSHVSTIGLFG